MKIKFTKLITILLCAIIILSSLQIFASLLIRNTLLSEKFYKEVTLSPNYIPMLRRNISFELDAQSRFVGIPLDFFTAALNDENISKILNEHIKNSALFLRGESEYKKAEYPSGLFLEQFEKFIESVKEENDEFVADEALYIQLAEVADDSAGIVEKHVNLMRFDAIMETGLFIKINRWISVMASALIPAVVLLILSIAALIYIFRKNINNGIFFIFTSLWISGTILFIPGVVMKQSGVTQRLAINTTYFKFAVDTWLGKINDFILIAGAFLFAVSSIILIITFFSNQLKKIRNIKHR